MADIRCAVCGAEVDQTMAWLHPVHKIWGCANCVVHGSLAKYVHQMETGYCGDLPSTKGVVSMAKKIDLTDKLRCPGCSAYSYNSIEKSCTACKQKEVGPEERLRQLLEFFEYICPFCHRIVRDLDNKLCMACKGRLSRKSVRKLRRKKILNGEAHTGATCTICGGVNTWNELNYCLDCGTIFGIMDGENKLYARIDGANSNAASLKILTFKLTPETPKTPLELKTALSIPRAEALKVAGIEVSGEAKGGEELIRISAKDYSEVAFEERELQLDGLTATVRVRYIKDSPGFFTIENYKINDFKEVCIPLILSALESGEEQAGTLEKG